MPRLFFTAVLLLLTAARALAQEAPQDSPAVLTLTAAIAEAQQNNRSIKISIQGVLYANDAILAAKTQRYPQFNVQLIGSGLLQAINVSVPENAFGTVNGSPVPAKDTVITTEPKLSALAFIQAYQPLTQLYSAHLNIQLMKAGKQLSEEQLRQQRQQITNDFRAELHSTRLSGFGGIHSRCAEIKGSGGFAAARLQDHCERRAGQAGGWVPEFDRGDGDFDRDDISCAGLSI
jgi:Outer membrane efflux protein